MYGDGNTFMNAMQVTVSKQAAEAYTGLHRKENSDESIILLSR